MTMKISFFIFVMLFCSALFSRDTDCRKVTEEIPTKSALAQQKLNGLLSLLGTSGEPTVPLEVIFQINVLDESNVTKRIKSLEQMITREDLIRSQEFLDLQKCSPKSVEVEKILSLRIQINTKKIAFLKLALPQRKELVAAYESARRSKQVRDGLDQQIENVSNAIISNEQQSEAITVDQGEVAASMALLRGTVNENEKKYLAFLAYFKDIKERLDELSNEFRANITRSTPTSTEIQLAAVAKVWSELVDELQGVFPQLNSFSIDELPSPTAPKVLDDKEFISQLQVARKRQVTITTNATNMIETLKNDSFILLSDVGTKRAHLIHKCDLDESSCLRARGIRSENLANFMRELKIIPLKIEAGLTARWFEAKRKLDAGLDGWIDLSYQVLILLFLLLISIFFSRILDWVARKTDEVRKDIISKSVLDYRRRTSYAIWLTHLVPFINPLGMLGLCYFSKSLLLQTDLPELSLVLYYLQLFYSYKLSRLIVKIVLQTLFVSESNHDRTKLRSSISTTAKSISRLIFIQLLILNLISDTAREALVYNLFSSIVFWINILFFLTACRTWGTQIERAFERRFPRAWIRLEPRFKSLVRFFLLPIMLIMCLGLDISYLVARWLSQFDFTKKILSEIFKKKLQSAEAEPSSKEPPPHEYLQFFDYYLTAKDSFFIEREASTLTDVSTKIADWNEGKKSDDLVIVVGNRGMGKSTTLERLHSKQEGVLKSVLSKIPAKTLDSKSFYTWLSEILDAPINSVEDFLAFDKQSSQKRVLFVDDIQNLFLSSIQGFIAYEIFIELIGLRTKNIFWCLTVNSRSWSYLKGVYGHEHFYGTSYELRAWRDVEIQQLIVARHKQTQYVRQFDKSIKAYGASDSVGQQAEAQFFRLLWGQSRGNPRSAMMYWISAISSPAEKSIHVGVPHFIDSSVVGRMSDEGHFLLASIARHESLTYDELIVVTSVSAATIRKCLKEFSDRQLTWTDEVGRVRITSKSQYVVDYFLMGKNFLYE